MALCFYLSQIFLNIKLIGLLSCTTVMGHGAPLVYFILPCIAVRQIKLESLVGRFTPHTIDQDSVRFDSLDQAIRSNFL